jgi:hypothetical protein
MCGMMRGDAGYGVFQASGWGTLFLSGEEFPCAGPTRVVIAAMNDSVKNDR